MIKDLMNQQNYNMMLDVSLKLCLPYIGPFELIILCVSKNITRDRKGRELPDRIYSFAIIFLVIKRGVRFNNPCKVSVVIYTTFDE